MAIEIIATKGAVDANSYATVAEADSFFASIYGADEWGSLTADVKAQLLITATLTIDDIPLVCGSVDSLQSLKFPLNNADDGYTKAKRACLWQALHLMKNYDNIEEGRTNKIQGVRQEVISKIQKTVAGYNPFAAYHPQVLKILSSFTDYNFIVRRG